MDGAGVSGCLTGGEMRHSPIIRFSSVSLMRLTRSQPPSRSDGMCGGSSAPMAAASRAVFQSEYWMFTVSASGHDATYATVRSHVGIVSPQAAVARWLARYTKRGGPTTCGMCSDRNARPGGRPMVLSRNKKPRSNESVSILMGQSLYSRVPTVVGLAVLKCDGFSAKKGASAR